VGWFTNVYAVSLDCSDDNEISIINAKDTMRSIPDSGMGYGYVKHTATPDICFNYLGDFTGSKTSYFGEYSTGSSVADENITDDKILINGQVTDGKLAFIIESKVNEFGIDFINRLKTEFENSVNELADFCAESVHDEKTASDYGIRDMTYSEFEILKKKLSGDVEKIYGLTPLQEGMLFHNLESDESTGYVLQNVFTLNKILDKQTICSALRLLSMKFEILRTSFIYEGISDPKQVIYTVREPEFEYIENDDPERIVQSDLKRGFDLESDTMLRMKSIVSSAGESTLIITMHHIVVDGWCLTTVINKFMEYYDRLSNGVSEKMLADEIIAENKETASYSTYIEWLGGQDKEKAMKYWEEQLAGYDSDCNIVPASKPESTEEQMRKQLIGLTPEVTKKLRKIAEKCECTINTVAETAVGIMLQAYSGSNDVVFGKVVSGRNADIPGIENIVGLFINTIPVRVTVDDKIRVRDLIVQQQKQGTESTNYDYCSLADIQGLTPQGNELIKVLYVFENFDSGLDNEGANT